MAIWIIGILFFVVAFVPRFFTFMNFGYGFSDLGLYSQFLAGLSENKFNVLIPTFGKNFLELKPEPFLFLLAPLSHLTVSPATFLFLDIFCLIVAAGACARVGWVKLHNLPLVNALFFVILFAPLTLESLHSPSRVTVWAQAPLALLMAEYALKRRPSFLTLWFSILCAMNLVFGALAVILIPLLLLTRRKRWNFQRRFSMAWPLGFIGGVSLVMLHLTGHQLVFEHDFFWATLGSSIIIWLISFWTLPLISVEYLVLALFLLLLKIPGSPRDVSLIFPLGALAAVNSLEILSIRERWLMRIVAAGMVATVVYLNLTSDDPFLTPWKPEHHQIMTQNKQIHDLLAKIPPDALVVASETLACHLTQHPTMVTLGAWEVRHMSPDYVVSLNQPTPFDHDRRYQAIEIKSGEGTRLLLRIK